MAWWNAGLRNREKDYYQAIPSMIILELWKSRNSIKHDGKNISASRVISNITRNLDMLVKVRKSKKRFSI